MGEGRGVAGDVVSEEEKVMDDSFKDRCVALHQKLVRDAMLRQGDPAQTILEFVLSERGRSADKSLSESWPVVLYFGSEQDQEEFIALIRAAKPGMVAKKVPMT